MKKIVLCMVVFVLAAHPVYAQQGELVRLLVTSPYVNDERYQAVADVVAGTLMREFLRAGGIVLLDREESERIIREDGGEGWAGTRQEAAAIGMKMDADVVVFSRVERLNNVFNYIITFYQVTGDIVQQAVRGQFKITESPSGIGRLIQEQAAKLQKYVPFPGELEDPGINLRVTMVAPLDLPVTHEIADIPQGTRFGAVEQVFSYYRVFPGEEEYLKFAEGTMIMRFHLEEDIDQDIRDRFNIYNTYGDFAIRHNLQAYFIENCSTGAINLLIANNIPVFYNDDVITGYTGLAGDSFCIFKTLYDNYFDTADMTHRDRMAVMFMVPQPGRVGGVPRDYLESAIAEFKDEWGETPTLVEITEGLLDISSSPD